MSDSMRENRYDLRTTTADARRFADERDRLAADVERLTHERDAADAKWRAILVCVRIMCPCRCAEDYKIRGMTDPNCPWHQYAVEILPDDEVAAGPAGGANTKGG